MDRNVNMTVTSLRVMLLRNVTQSVRRPNATSLAVPMQTNVKLGVASQCVWWFVRRPSVMAATAAAHQSSARPCAVNQSAPRLARTTARRHVKSQCASGTAKIILSVPSLSAI